MAKPGVEITIDDQSYINTSTAPVEDNVDRPRFLVVSSADKGPEEFVKNIYGDTFYQLYGRNLSFYKHGQPLIQAANIIDAGGYVTFKRIVANDSTLANIGVVAEVRNKQKQKTDENGIPLYIDTNTGKETTEAAGNQPVMENHVNIAYKLKTIALDGNNVSSFANEMLANFGHTNNIGEDGDYPLFIICDNGRGVSNKRFRIYTDSTVSHPVEYVRYFIDIIENGETLETIVFTMDPDIIENDINMSLYNVIKINSKQIRAHFFEDEYKAFAENVSYLIGEDKDSNDFIKSDVLFGIDLYGSKYSNISIDTEVNLSTIYGISLENGSNGSFQERPIAADTYTTQLKKAFDGSFDDTIYDLDNNRIDVVADANYPQVVKRAIEQLVNFREDCMYFRDMGIGISSMEELKLRDADNSKSRYCATYMNSYDVYDPFTKKQITVTVTYDLARLFVKHFINGRTRPFCGQKYDVVIPSDKLVDGTLNFTPKITPQVDQKKEVDDMRINYCSYYNGNILTMNSQYTSQTVYTQLSWINNVLAIQEIVKAIRVLCPKIRYSFLDGEDLTRYKQDVQNMILDKYKVNFADLSINYVSNDLYDLNKIIYAVITVKLRNFVQTEKFKITVIN